MVAGGSPTGRSSTAQGLFGAAGTVGFIVSSLVAGRLAAIDIRLPFWFFVVTMLTSLAIGLAIGGRRIVAIGLAAAPAAADPAALTVRQVDPWYSAVAGWSSGSSSGS